MSKPNTINQLTLNTKNSQSNSSAFPQTLQFKLVIPTKQYDSHGTRNTSTTATTTKNIKIP